MIEQRQDTTELANLLRRHQDEIAALWAEQVYNLSTGRYSQRPLHELHSSAQRGLKDDGRRHCRLSDRHSSSAHGISHRISARQCSRDGDRRFVDAVGW